MKPGQNYYYSDELNDEFSGITRDTMEITHTYKYIHKSIWWKISSFVVYRVIMTPVAYLYMKICFHMKVKNRALLKKGSKEGYFLYGNHTQVPGDGYIPTVLTFPKRDIVIVNADNVSLKGTRTFMEMIGAYPLPTNMTGMKHFVKGLSYYAKKNQSIVIYPEAHIWPYYTEIRPFTDRSFVYPVMFSKPAYCFTTTYQKRKHSKKPNITVYIDGPFFPDSSLKMREAQSKLRNDIYHAMKERSKKSTYQYVNYIRKSCEDKEK